MPRACGSRILDRIRDSHSRSKEIFVRRRRSHDHHYYLFKLLRRYLDWYPRIIRRYFYTFVPSYIYDEGTKVPSYLL